MLWATAASLVPAMSKGNEAARTAHITLNSLNLLLFAWQVCFFAMTRRCIFGVSCCHTNQMDACFTKNVGVAQAATLHSNMCLLTITACIRQQ